MYQKIYDEASQIVPINLIMKKRSLDHHKNVNDRINAPLGDISTNSEAVCLNAELYGVMCEVKKKDKKKLQVHVEFNHFNETSKIHHPFFAEMKLKQV
jgi:hypothetical protein